MIGKSVIVAHGGAGSRNEYADGTETSVHKGLDSMRSGMPALESVCLAVSVLEDDSRFNAGTGSQKRSDGRVQMDAACMDSNNQFGAVAVIEGYKNPVHIAHAVSKTKYRVLAGQGAAEFAREQKFPAWDPQGAQEDPPPVSSSDTVGCVAFDGELYAAALSTGGTKNAIPGRVGDVPLIGCGLYAGPHGAVAATGHGEEIAMKMTAFRVYQMLEGGMDPKAALKTALDWFEENIVIGLILVSRKGFAGGSNRTMAWSSAEHTQ